MARSAGINPFGAGDAKGSRIPIQQPPDAMPFRGRCATLPRMRHGTTKGGCMPFDIVFIGHYTKDTIVYPTVTRVVDGGAFNYGANVAARMGLRVAVVTRLAREDWHVVESLEAIGVTAFAKATPQSTCLRLTYPTDNLDQRTIELTSSAGPFTLDEVAGLAAKAYAVGASVRGEVPTEVVEALAAKRGIMALDVQGFLRIVRNDTLVTDGWPGKEEILRHVTVLKTDAVEAELITGEPDRYIGAKRPRRLRTERGPPHPQRRGARLSRQRLP